MYEYLHPSFRDQCGISRGLGLSVAEFKLHLCNFCLFCLKRCQRVEMSASAFGIPCMGSLCVDAFMSLKAKSEIIWKSRSQDVWLGSAAPSRNAQ